MAISPATMYPTTLFPPSSPTLNSRMRIPANSRATVIPREPSKSKTFRPACSRGTGVMYIEIHLVIIVDLELLILEYVY